MSIGNWLLSFNRRIGGERIRGSGPTPSAGQRRPSSDVQAAAHQAEPEPQESEAKATQLRTLKALLADGIITQEDFDNAMRRLPAL